MDATLERMARSRTLVKLCVPALVAAWGVVTVPLNVHAQQPGASPGAPPAKTGLRQSADDSVAAAEPLDETVPIHHIFQLGVALLALPAANVCSVSTSACEPGETSIAFGLQNLGRIGDIGFGAGITWAFGLRPADPALGDPDGTLGRDHSRSYFLVEGQFRYYPPPLGSFHWWAGPQLGFVVVNDSWSTLADREPYADTDFVGPKALTIATEGLSIGAGIGGNLRFGDHWFFGTRFRYANWILPSEREVTPQQDLASLAGRVDIFDFGLVAGYRLPI